MKIIKHVLAIIVATNALFGMFSDSAFSEVIIVAMENGNDVVFQGNGALNLEGLIPGGSGGGSTLVLPETPGGFAVFSTGGGWDDFTGYTDPGPIGPGSEFVFGSSVGDALFISSAIGVPQGYTSGPIEFTTTFSNESFASIGLVEGTYVWSWESDQITLHIGPVPILFGDVNLDGVVDLLDIAPFVALLTTNGFQVEADINQDGIVDLLDIAPFVEILSG